MIRVISASGLILIQDAGRPGHMHAGVPPGGPLVPELHAVANRAVGNPPDTAALEIFGAFSFSVDSPIWTSTDDARPTLAHPAECHDVRPSPLTRVRYLAFAGGIDSPKTLGSQGALLVAHIGAPIRRSDVLRVHLRPAPVPVPVPVSPPDLLLDSPIRCVPVTDSPLFSTDFTISPIGDRSGIRLSGSRLPAPPPLPYSAPMVRGAIEVPPSGEPIVLGPDHPTTGGYPVCAVILRADLGRFFARRPGAAVRFTPA